MATILLYGDTVRHAAMRHEVPLEIVDPLLFAARDGRAFVLTSSLEAERISKALPGAELLVVDELGLFELVEQGMPLEEAELETAVRAVERWNIRDVVVPGDLPVAVADRLRAAGIRVEVDMHESPWLGLGSGETLVAGDVIAVEPGIEGLEGVGGVRFEDLLLITGDGCETLTCYPYDL